MNPAWHDLPVAQHESDLSFQHEERLIFPMVDVGRWATAGQHTGFAQGIGAAGLFTGGEESIDITDRREGRAFAWFELDKVCWSGHNFKPSVL